MNYIVKPHLALILIFSYACIFIHTHASVPRSNAVLVTILNDINAPEKDVKSALYELTAAKTPEACTLVIAYLHQEEIDIPATLPKPEDLAAIERSMKTGSLPLRHWTFRITHLLQTIVSLVEFNMPQSNSEVSLFMQRLIKGYGDDESGRKIVELFQRKITGAQADLKAGAVPWKTGISDQGSE